MKANHSSVPVISRLDGITPIVNIKPVISAKDQRYRAFPKRMTLLIPCFNESNNLGSLISSLYDATHLLCDQLTILVVDDGSSDGSVLECKRLSERYPVQCLQLSRNFGKENAITAGLDHVDADVVVIIDGDGQHPSDTISEFVEKWRQYYDMVYGVRRAREEQPYWKKITSRFFYWIVRGGGQRGIVANAGDFRLLDRKVVEALQKLPENNRFMKGLYSWVGFRCAAVPFNVIPRTEGESHFNFFRLFDLAVTAVTAFSNAPPRVWSGIGAMTSLLALLYGGYVFMHTLIFGNEVPGWTTLMVGMLFLGGVQLLSIGVLGEYIGRIFAEVKKRPAYIVEMHHKPDSKVP